ncbi:MAG: DUF1287 domain-containing protein [Elusimicrobia bacterium]|nr:DUF1287 domain-containing protein [Elusimicrobiota bacterium]
MLRLAALSLLLALPASAARRSYPNASAFIAAWLKAYRPGSAPPDADAASARRLAEAALAQTRTKVVYDPAYFKLAYPGGDPPADRGVCTDVVVRAYRALGVDLQVAVHEDMAARFDAYPDLWKRGRPDANIDHRRVPNLMVFLARRGAALPLSTRPDDYRAGEVVAYDLGGGVTHVAVVSERRSADGKRPLIVHNIGEGPKLEDALLSWRVIGRFRYYGPPRPAR